MFIERAGDRLVNDLFHADLPQPALSAVATESQFTLHVAAQPAQVRIDKIVDVDAGDLVRLDGGHRLLERSLWRDRRALGPSAPSPHAGITVLAAQVVLVLAQLRAQVLKGRAYGGMQRHRR